MKIEDLRTRKQVLTDALKDPAFRERWERTALARAVAIRLLIYRADHKLSQTRLAEKLGMKQPAVARLEDGEVNPTWETLVRLSEKLDIEFVVDIVPPRRRSMVGSRIKGAAMVRRTDSARGSLLVAAS